MVDHAMNGALRFTHRSGCYEGHTENRECRLQVAKDTMSLARHMAVMRGDAIEDLLQVETWIERPDLLALDGVEVEDA
jgi:hypothetical protein